MSDPNKSLYNLAAIMLLLTSFFFYQIGNYTIPKNYRISVVKVYGKAGHGSGSIVKTSSYKSQILTNRHVCKGIAYTDEEITKIKEITNGAIICAFDPYGETCQKIRSDYNKYINSLTYIGKEVSVKFNNLDHKDIKGKVLKISDKYDLCLVEVKEGNLPTISISRTQAVPGDKIISIGNPMYMENAQTEGYVGDNINHEGNTYQHHTGIIFGGNSGGPVCNQRGELVGVNTLGTQEPTASYMIPLEDIKKFLEE